MLRCRWSVNKLHDSDMKKILLILACGFLFLGTTKAFTSTEESSERIDEICDRWVNDNMKLAILQQIPLSGEKAFVRDEPGHDAPTDIRLFKVVATNASEVTVGTIIIVESGHDPQYVKPEKDVQTREFYILDLESYSVKMLDKNVAFYFADNATCIRIGRDKAESYIKRLSTGDSEKR